MDRIDQHEDDLDLGAARVETRGDFLGNTPDEDRVKVGIGMTDE